MQLKIPRKWLILALLEAGLVWINRDLNIVQLALLLALIACIVITSKVKESWWWLLILAMPIIKINGSVSWWMLGSMIMAWILLYKYGYKASIVLVGLVILNLYLNKLLNWGNQGISWDWERMNMGNPHNALFIETYRQSDLTLPYRIRGLLYGDWMSVLLWIDSSLKLLSPLYWLRLLGFSGAILVVGGIYQWVKVKTNWWWGLWLLVVVISSGMGVQLDTKNSVIMALPVIIGLGLLGLKDKEKYKYWLMTGLVIDVLLR